MALLEGDYWLEKVCEHWDYLERREEKRKGGEKHRNQDPWRFKTKMVTFSQSVRRAYETISHKPAWDQVTEEAARRDTQNNCHFFHWTYRGKEATFQTLGVCIQQPSISLPSHNPINVRDSHFQDFRRTKVPRPLSGNYFLLSNVSFTLLRLF